MFLYIIKLLKYYIPFFLLGVTFGCKKEPVFRFPAKPIAIIEAGDSRLQANIIQLVQDTVYILKTNITVASGQTLQIQAGTLIKIDYNFTIRITTGGVINAKGKTDAPIIFTLNSLKGLQKTTWGGIEILGNANGNSSGVLSYVRIEFAGSRFGPSLSLQNVTNNTILNNIQVSNSDGISFTFSGGNCNANNLISYSGTGIDFNILNGYKGYLQNILAYRHPGYANVNLNLAGIMVDGIGTEPAISNATVLGPGLAYGINGNYTLGGTNRRAGIITLGNSKFHIRNSVILGPPSQRDPTNVNTTDFKSIRSYYLDSRGTAASLDSGRADITYSAFYENGNNTFYLPDKVYPVYPPTTPVTYSNSNDLREFLLRPKYNNQIIASLTAFNLIDPYNYFGDGIPNPFPNTVSAVLSGANFTDVSVTSVFTDSFFKPVTYRGALGADNWMQGWVNFNPLQTDYNN
ncbi:hypothetical protein [Ferruginibacter sp.]